MNNLLKYLLVFTLGMIAGVLLCVYGNMPRPIDGGTLAKTKEYDLVNKRQIYVRIQEYADSVQDPSMKGLQIDTRKSGRMLDMSRMPLSILSSNTLSNTHGGSSGSIAYWLVTSYRLRGKQDWMHSSIDSVINYPLLFDSESYGYKQGLGVGQILYCNGSVKYGYLPTICRSDILEAVDGSFIIEISIPENDDRFPYGTEIAGLRAQELFPN